MHSPKNLNNILFIVADPVQKQNYANTLPPVGVLSIATLLRKNNIKAEVTDLNIENINKWDIKDFDVIGFSILHSNIENSLRISSEIKQRFPEKAIIAGGPHVNSYPEFFIKKEFFDLVAVGEGEYALLELFQQNPINGIKGLYYKDEQKQIQFNGYRDRIKNLDLLPFPDLSLVNYKNYYIPIKKTEPVSYIMSSRGCPFNCIFCFQSLGKQWFSRSPENVVEEIEYQINTFSVKELCIFDDNFTLDIERAKKICRLLLEKKIQISIQLTNGIRVDSVDRELLSMMKEIGLWFVALSPETGSQETMKKIEKNFNLEKVFEVVQICKELNLVTDACYMIGFPWEKKEDIEKTIDFALQLNADISQFSRVVPIPGTKLFNQMGLDKNLNFDKDNGILYGTTKHKTAYLDKKTIHKLIKKAYRKYYFNPKRILRIFKLISIKDFFKLIIYAIRTKSI